MTTPLLTLIFPSNQANLADVADVVTNPSAWVNEAGLAVGSEDVIDSEITYLDTFDGRIYRRGVTLSVDAKERRRELVLSHPSGQTKGRWRIRKSPSTAETLPLASSTSRTGPGSSGGHGELADVISTIGIRALIPVLVWKGEVRSARIVDPLEKTVALLTSYVGVLAMADGSHVKAPSVVMIEPLKGFSAHGEALASAAAAYPSLAGDLNIFHCLAESAGISPAGYDTRLRLTCEPDAPVRDALRELLTSMLDTVKATLPGVLADTDSEYLHDFRVSVRRARSLLGRFKAHFSGSALDHLVGELKWLGNITGPTRDLDVFLINAVTYLRDAPPEDEQGLVALGEHLHHQRRLAQRRLARELKSERFVEFIQWWTAWLEALDNDGVEEPRARQAADAAIAKQWKRLLKQGDAIHPETPVEALHALRIEGKKMRYLLEAFSPLYPGRPMKRIIREIKRLQNNLGDLQDYEIQQVQLRQFAHDMAARSSAAPVEALVAVGRQIERLAGKQQNERERFSDVWTKVAAPKHRRTLRDLCAPKVT